MNDRELSQIVKKRSGRQTPFSNINNQLFFQNPDLEDDERF